MEDDAWSGRPLSGRQRSGPTRRKAVPSLGCGGGPPAAPRVTGPHLPRPWGDANATKLPSPPRPLRSRLHRYWLVVGSVDRPIRLPKRRRKLRLLSPTPHGAERTTAPGGDPIQDGSRSLPPQPQGRDSASRRAPGARGRVRPLIEATRAALGNSS